jgi:hypothetical protein
MTEDNDRENIHTAATVKTISNLFICTSI